MSHTHARTRARAHTHKVPLHQMLPPVLGLAQRRRRSPAAARDTIQTRPRPSLPGGHGAGGTGLLRRAKTKTKKRSALPGGHGAGGTGLLRRSCRRRPCGRCAKTKTKKRSDTRARLWHPPSPRGQALCPAGVYVYLSDRELIGPRSYLSLCRYR